LSQPIRAEPNPSDYYSARGTTSSEEYGTNEGINYGMVEDGFRGSTSHLPSLHHVYTVSQMIYKTATFGLYLSFMNP